MSQNVTPEDIKQILKPYLFPCFQNKKPNVQSGYSWEKDNKYKKPFIRDINSPLLGLDCGHAGIVVCDFDIYKKEFKESKLARDFLKECQKKSKFQYKTPKGGLHIFFKQHPQKPIGCPVPFPGVEIKGLGGYVCIYKNPASLGGYEDFTEFYKDLPDWDFEDFKKTIHREFGPGKNNKAVPQRAGKAGRLASITKAKKDIKELFKNNKGNKELDKHLEDYLNVLSNNWTPIQDNTPQTKKTKTIFQSRSLSEVDIKKTKYIDNNKLFLDCFLNVVSGDKATLKSRGVLSYLLDQDLKIAYYSDWENTDSTIKKIAIAQKKLENLKLYDLDLKPSYEDLKAMLIKDKIQVLMEDPPCEDINFANQQGIRQVLGKRAKLADELNISLVVTRNYSKNASSILLNRVGGFKQWTNIPRAVLIAHRADFKSPEFAGFQGEIDNDKIKLLQASLLQTEIINEGPRPKNSLVMLMQAEGKKEPYFTFTLTNRQKKPELWGKERDNKKIEKEAETFTTREKLTLIKIGKEGIPSNELKKWMCAEFKIEWTTATTLIKALKNMDFISGGGQGRHSQPFKITEKGEDFLNETED